MEGKASIVYEKEKGGEIGMIGVLIVIALIIIAI